MVAYMQGYIMVGDPVYGHFENKEITNKFERHIHHLDEDRTNNKKDNLIILCAKCHKARHMEEY